MLPRDDSELLLLEQYTHTTGSSILHRPDRHRARPISMCTAVRGIAPRSVTKRGTLMLPHHPCVSSDQNAAETSSRATTAYHHVLQDGASLNLQPRWMQYTQTQNASSTGSTIRSCGAAVAVETVLPPSGLTVRSTFSKALTSNTFVWGRSQRNTKLFTGDSPIESSVSSTTVSELANGAGVRAWCHKVRTERTSARSDGHRA